MKIIEKMKKEIEKELTDICNEIIDQLEKVLIPNSNDHSSKVFYHKMKADYHRYVAEIVDDK